MATCKDLDTGSDQIIQLCSLCDSNVCDGYCDECEDYMCQSCFDIHSRVRNCRHHVLLNDARQKGNEKACSEPCKRHPNQCIKFYCVVHKIVGCVECFFPEHRNCNYQNIEDAAKIFHDSGEDNRLKKEVQILENTHGEYRRQSEQDKESVAAINNTAVNAVMSFVDTITSYGAQVKKLALGKSERLRIENETRLEKRLSELDSVGEEIELCSETLKKQDRTDKLFIAAVELKPKIEILGQQINSLGCRNDVKKYVFQPNKLVLEKIKELNNFGELCILPDTEENIDPCKSELEEKPEKQYMHSKKKIEDYAEVVKILKQDEIALLDVSAIVNINIDTRSGIVTIDGPIKQVDAAIYEMRLKLLKIECSKNEANTAEELSKIVQWYYEEIMDSGDVKAKPYNKKVNYKIEEAYKANKKHIKFESDGHTYVVDFQQLVEYDENDKDDAVRVIRKDILKEAKGALPDVWTKMNVVQNLISVPLDQGDAIYKTIEQRFINEVKNGKISDRVKFFFDASKVRVLKIERVQNKTLYRQYQAKKKYMTEQKPNLPSNMPIEREVWHGMKPDVIPSIQNHGFNRSYSGAANGQPWYGEGVYFAGDASYSCRDWLTGSSGGKGHMFLVNVLTGQYCKGTKNMRYLPAVDPAKPTIMYDSAVDYLANPFEFVIFNDTQAYPAYLVTFAT